MASNHPQIPTIDLVGTPRQIGAAHGEALRSLIVEHISRFFDCLLPLSVIPLTKQTLWEKWSGQVAINREFAPSLIEEMEGIARGANVPFEHIFLLNSTLDLATFGSLEMAKRFPGCSSFAVVAEAGTGKTLIGQTYDMFAFYEDLLAVMRVRPEGGPGQLVITFAGVVAGAGLNEAGIAVCINYLRSLDVGIGRLQSVIVRQILGGTHLADAVAPAVLPPRAGGSNYLIADKRGNVLDIETTGKRQHISYTDGNVMVHTNHYLADYLKDVEYMRPTTIGNSIARYCVLRRFIRTQENLLTVESLKELTKNHDAYPESVCAHPIESEESSLPYKTVCAMVQIPADGVLYLAKGCACENAYHPVTF